MFRSFRILVHRSQRKCSHRYYANGSRSPVYARSAVYALRSTVYGFWPTVRELRHFGYELVVKKNFRTYFPVCRVFFLSFVVGVMCLINVYFIFLKKLKLKVLCGEFLSAKKSWPDRRELNKD